MKKNLAGLGIEPQDYKMSCFETWCLSPQHHEISINWGSITSILTQYLGCEIHQNS